MNFTPANTNGKNAVFKQLEGILDGHSKENSPHAVYVKRSPAETAFLEKAASASGRNINEIVAVGFGLREANGAEQINAIYLTELGEVEWQDLEMREGYKKLKGLTKAGFILSLPDLINNGSLSHIMTAFQDADVVPYNLSNEEGNPKVLLMYTRQEKPRNSEQSRRPAFYPNPYRG